MTDHSILTPGLPELPFQKEARLVTRVLYFFGTKAPQVLRSAIATRDIYETVSRFNEKQLSALGIHRTGIAAYAAEKSGLLKL